jgi:hypothetical protein
MNMKLNKVGMAYRNGYEVERLRTAGFYLPLHLSKLSILRRALVGTRKDSCTSEGVIFFFWQLYQTVCQRSGAWRGCELRN